MIFGSISNKILSAYKSGDFNKVIELSAKINDDDSYLLNVVASAFYNKLQFETALDHVNKAIKIEPNQYEFYFNRARIYEELKEFEKAHKDYNRCMCMNLNDPDCYINRGGVRFILKKFNESIKDFSKAIDLTKGDPMVYYNRGLVYLEIGEKQNAISDFEKASSLGVKEAKEKIKEIS